jgi:glycosyltransferase involved in cell wall biosynthesis
MSAVRVYILLATCQGESWLPELLRSIQAQSHSDWTLLVRDDDSSDATPQILQQAALQDRRIVIAKSDGRRLGAIGNFAWLLQEARENLADDVLLADQDDIWHADKVARQLDVLHNDTDRAVPRLVFCDAAVVDARRRLVHSSFLRHNRLPYRCSAPLKTLLGRSFVLGCACALNRVLLELALPLPEAAASHDWWLALCAASAGQIACLDEPLLEYRRHPASASQAVFWNVLRGSQVGWRRRWDIGWRSFLQSLEQAKALRHRLHERGIVNCEQSELLDAYCRILEKPGRWRRLRELYRLGLPAIDWRRRLLFAWCMMLTAPSRPANSGT